MTNIKGILKFCRENGIDVNRITELHRIGNTINSEIAKAALDKEDLSDVSVKVEFIVGWRQAAEIVRSKK